MNELSTLEGMFFMVSFITGFTAALVVGTLIHDFFDRRRRFFKKMLQNLWERPKQ